MDGKLDPVAFEALDGDTTDPNFMPRGHGLWHIEHCFNYIRHALQCYGDTTMEVPTDFNGQLIFIGWNTTHQCRNFDAIWDYTDAEYIESIIPRTQVTRAVCLELG